MQLQGNESVEQYLLFILFIVHLGFNIFKSDSTHLLVCLVFFSQITSLTLVPHPTAVGGSRGLSTLH